MSSIIVNQFESLSNELLLDIFEYLDVYNLYQTFYGLNHRLNNLLRLANLHIQSNSLYNNQTVWDSLKIFFNSSQIRILSTYNDANIDKEFLSSYNKNLRSICLVGVNRDYMDNILEYFSIDNQLNSIYLQNNWEYATNKNSIVDLVLIKHAERLTSLINLSLVPSYYIYQFSQVTVIFSKLRRLSITNCYLTTEFLQFLEKNTPNLRSLKYSGYYSNENLISKNIKHIDELDINGINDLSNLNMILSSFPCLRRLHIGWQYNRRYSIINGRQLQQIIEKYLSNLKQLTIDFDQSIDEEILKTFYIGEFWLKKKVKAKMIINKLQSRYRLWVIHKGRPSKGGGGQTHMDVRKLFLTFVKHELKGVLKYIG